MAFFFRLSVALIADKGEVEPSPVSFICPSIIAVNRVEVPVGVIAEFDGEWKLTVETRAESGEDAPYKLARCVATGAEDTAAIAGVMCAAASDVGCDALATCVPVPSNFWAKC